MKDPSIPARDGNIGWKPVPSTVTDADLDAFESEIALAFPPLYRDFLKYRHFLDLSVVGVAFENHLIDGWRETLGDLYRAFDPEYIVGRGLIPFGSEHLADAGLVCFDTRHRRADGDCPVVFWDHDWVDGEEAVQPMFSSSARMFSCLSLAAETDVDFVYHDDTDPPDELPQKRSLLRQFLDLDPEGAGGPARKHWTCWGVDPRA